MATITLGVVCAMLGYVAWRVWRLNVERERCRRFRQRVRREWAQVPEGWDHV